MDIQKIKDKSIVDYLSKRGIHPKRKGGRNWAYLSPIGGETVPSFMVDVKRNRFKDFHSGAKGDIIDLVKELDNCDFKTACKELEQGEHSHITVHEPVKDLKPGIEIHNVKPLTDKKLIGYFVHDRKINEEVLMKYCSEVSFSFVYGSNPNKVYNAVGFKNDMGGYELRSDWQKVSTAPKSFTTVQGDDSKIMLWEGFTDFMSYLTYNNILVPEYKTFVLNGLSMINLIKPLIEGKTALWYGDNDKPSDNALKEIDAIDMRSEFGFYEDYNEMIKQVM